MSKGHTGEVCPCFFGVEPTGRMMRLGNRFALLLLLAMSLLSCPLPAQAIDSPGIHQALMQTGDALSDGIALYRQGRLDEALSLFRGQLVRENDPRREYQLCQYLARIFLDQGRGQEALLYLNRIPQGQRTATDRLLAGEAEVQAGDVEAGVAALLALEDAPLESPDQQRRLQALAQGKAAQGQYLQALFFLHRGLTVDGSPQQRQALLAQAHDLLQNRMNRAGVEEAAFMFAASPLGADAQLQLAKKDLAEGNREEARRQVEAALAHGDEFLYRSEAAQLLDQLIGHPWLQQSIGVILPLTGRYATFGDLVKRGMDLALTEYNRTHPMVEFVYRDSAPGPEETARLVSDLALSDRVLAIAGPLTGAAALAAAEQAEREQIPLLALSQRDGLPEIGPYVFRDSLTSRLQVESLVRYAMTELGISRFGVLAPQNKLGSDMTELFVAQVSQYGGQVVKVQTYEEKATDFGRQIKLLRGLDPNAPAEEEKPSAEETAEGEEPYIPVGPEPPPVDFDALFIPDYADRVSMIAPQLAFYGIERVPLLGINGWNSPDLIRLAGPYVEGAIFVDGFFVHSPLPFVQEFVAHYFETYGEEPTILEAQGFDAANILLSLLNQPEVTDRASLRRELQMMNGFPGVTGVTSFGPFGDAEKGLFILQVQEGNIVQLQ